jgi:hypothetical protein
LAILKSGDFMGETITKGKAYVGELRANRVFINGTEVTAASLGIIDPITVYSAGALSKGDLVYISGYNAGSGKPAVTKADADFPEKAAQYVVAADIAPGATGAVYAEGVVTGIDTSGAGAVGDPLYLSATAGQFTATAPFGADQICQVVGTVMVKNAQTGSARFYPGKNLILAQGKSALQAGAVSETELSADDAVASTFLLGPVVQNFGASADAVATKLTDSAPCKLEVLQVLATVIEAKAGGAVDDATKIAKEAVGTTAMSGVITCDMSDLVYSNKIGSCVSAMGVGGANAQVAKGADIFIFTGAAADRSAGKYAVMAICKKIG